MSSATCQTKVLYDSQDGLAKDTMTLTDVKVIWLTLESFEFERVSLVEYAYSGQISYGSKVMWLRYRFTDRKKFKN